MTKSRDGNRFGGHYSEEALWQKLKRFALAAGSKVVYSALVLFYTAQAKNTPVWAKKTIIGALGYFIFPADAIPDWVPAAGYSDDLGVLLFALATVAAYVTPEAKEKAKARMGVGEGGLYQNPGHEGQGPGRVSWLCLDREGFSDQCRALASGCQPWYRSLEGLRRRY